MSGGEPLFAQLPGTPIVLRLLSKASEYLSNLYVVPPPAVLNVVF